MALELDNNKMAVPIDPNLPAALVFKHIEDAQWFSMVAKALYAHVQMVKAIETLIVKMSKYHLAYDSWLGKPDADKTYVDFKTHFTSEH